MKKNSIYILLLIGILLLSACQKTTTPSVNETPATESTTVQAIEKVEPESEEAQIDYMAITMDVLDTGDLKEIKKVLIENVPMLSHEDADIAINRYISLLNEGLYPLTDQYYGEEFNGIHQALNEVINLNLLETESIFGFVGLTKYAVLDVIEDDAYSILIKETFDQGIGLFSAEGSYYPVIDYVSLNANFSEFVSEPMKAYLKMTSQELINPLFVEEYLYVTPMVLAERAIEYEGFLMSHSDFIHIEDIRRQLMMSIYKLAGPNIFDGMLNNDFRFSDNLQEAYDFLLTKEEFQVTYFATTKIVDFSEKKGGVLGTYEDMDDLYDQAFETHQMAAEMIEELYLK